MDQSLVIITILSFLLLANPFVLAATSPHYNNNSTDQLLECLIFQFNNSSTSQSDHQVIYTPQNPYYSSIFKSSEQNLRPGSASKYLPLLIVTPFHESQIQATIYCSKKNGVQIKVRGGGHDYEGLSYTSQVPNFMIVDMRNLRTISIDTKDNTSWVKSGATLGELYYAIGQKSKTLAFTAGVCPTVGVGGHFTGGGYGMISRKHGISVDNIIDAKLINVEGRVLDRKSMGEDLFWAIRGGGGNSFGIILAFKLKLSVVPKIVTVFNVTKTLEQNATKLVHKWQYISHKIDENLLVRLFLKSVKSREDGKRGIAASFTSLFLGRVNDLLRIMQEKFPELGLAERDCVEMSWIESVLYFAGHDHQNEPLNVLLKRNYKAKYFKGKSDYVTTPIRQNSFKGIWKFLNEGEEENSGQVQLSPYGGILNKVSESETPFPHRSGNIYMIHYIAFWYTGESTILERNVNRIRRLYDYMAPFVSNSPRAAYFNYRDLDIGTNNNNIEGNTISYKEASVWGFKYFKNNFNRLVSVKTKVDPNNFFRNEQSVPPLSSHESRTIRLNVDDTYGNINDSVLI